MKKLYWVAPMSAAAILATAYTGTAWWAGKSAEQALQRQHQLLADLPYFAVKNREYQRGLFSSTERTTITLNPNLLRSTEAVARLAGQALPKIELTYTQRIQHGPLPLLFAGELQPLKAFVRTEIEYKPETKKLLSKFFGDKAPISIENRIHFNDDGQLRLAAPSFDYEEALAGVKAVWSGFSAQVDYSGDFNRNKMSATAPAFQFSVKDKGNFELKQLSFNSHSERGVAGLMLGEGKMNIAKISGDITDDSLFPVKFVLDNLDYRATTQAKGEFIDSQVSLDAASLLLNDKHYGPARMAVAAEHIHAATLAKLTTELGKVQRAADFNPETDSGKLVEIFKQYGLPLLKNDPQLALKELRVKLPEGELKLQADLGLRGFIEKDLEQPAKLLEKLIAHADLQLPKAVIENYVLWQARSMVEAQGGGGNPEDLDTLARGLMEGQIQRLSQQKLIVEQDGKLSTQAKFEAGKLTVNNTEIPLPWQLPAAVAKTGKP